MSRLGRPGSFSPTGPWAGSALGLAALLALGGCGSTTIGRRLSSSFEAPPPAVLSGAGTPGATGASSSTAEPATTQPAAPAEAQPASPSTSPPGAEPKAAGAKPAQPPLSPSPTAAQARPSAARGAAPVPYRVTIKLPAADPSAPAEVVTEALRAAGVRFEVETIERIRSGPAAAPSVTAAPAPSPLVTPAPPAR
ncbi:hypothetical protein [Cyanobium sp. ATX 6F1]|uniref:hypothetical protein n=1 Tax=unclassified Cyanobium TaxID=2627006 RepID=UPI0020CF34B2|nr:hypothetical protein [Cyanobium sp. ATX 6F1]MCP9915063.1 hypothetical protein [Cyanobium sp. ATX 6F1]